MPHLPRVLQASCWLRYIVSHPRRIILFHLLVTLLFAFQLPTLQFQTGIYDLVIEDLPQTQAYRDFKKTFGSEELILLVAKARDVFEPQTFRELSALSEKLSRVAGIKRVISLPGIRKAMDVTGSVSLARFQERVAPVTLFKRNLLSKDHKTTVISLILEDINEKGRIINDIEKIIREKRPGISLYQIGIPNVADALSRFTKKDFFRLPPITLLVIAFVLFVFLRNVSRILIPIGSVIMCLVWTFGLMSWTSTPLSMLTMIVPVFLLAVGTAYCMYTIPVYLRAAEQYPDPSEASYRCFVQIKFPTSLAVLTTVIGLGSLLVNHIEAIQQFALFSCFGILSMLIIILTFLPALFASFPLPQAKGHLRVDKGKDLLTRFLEKIIEINIHYQKFTLPLMAFITLLGLMGIFQIRVETNPIDYFKENAPVRRHFFDICQDMAGSFPLNVEIDTHKKDFFEDPDHLKEIENIQGFLNTLPGVDKTISFVDYLKLVRYTANRYQVSFYNLPDESFEVRMLVNDYKTMLGEDMFQRFVGTDLSSINVLMRTHISSSSDFLKTQKTIESYLRHHLPKGFGFQVTGIGLVISHTSRFLTTGQIKSLLLTLILIFIFMMVLFLSFKVGVIAMLPNIFPIVVNFGLMGWLNIPLSMVTSLVASIAIGLAVDDTIHYLVTYNSHFREDLRKRRALTKTILHMGSPIVFTSLAICLGFSVLLFSSFKPTAVFGLMMAVTMLSALVGDLVLLPSLMLHVELVTIWDLVRIRLGKDPQEGIRLFNGLSRSQVHYLLMAGGLKQFQAGEIIVRKGEISDSMYAVISGELDVVDVPLEGQDNPYRRGSTKVINMLRAGDVFGEMGLIRSCQRSATVLAITPVEVLVINDRMLSRLQWLYPPTASKVYKNLMTVVCDRLERLTGCFLEECVTDPRSSIISTEFFRILLDREWAAADRYGHPLSLAALRIHDPKTFAYPALEPQGALFQTLWIFLKSSLRTIDILCRYDNQLFVVLMPYTSHDEATKVLKRIRHLVSQRTFRMGKNEKTFSAHFGVASFEAGGPQRPEDLMKAALVGLRNAIPAGENDDDFLEKADN
jgi:uncharacterized protein